MLWRRERERELSELSISLGLTQVQYENSGAETSL